MFEYKKNELYCEDLKIADIAKKYGTPLYLYSYKSIKENFSTLKNAFKEINPLICFSVKSNSNVNILRELINLGAGLDIVSGGELFRAGKAGADMNKVVYAGVGKTEAEIIMALEKSIKLFNVESEPELELINEIAKKLGKKANVCFRINPDVDPKTHKYITTGKKENKFGLDFDLGIKLFKKADDFKSVKIKGIHLHIGSQIIEAKPFVDALNKAGEFIKKIRALGRDIEILNLGGGFGIVYKDEKPQSLDEIAKQMIPIIKEIKAKEVVFEPGRFIVGNAGVLITQVQYVKTNGEKKFAIVDSAMNDLIRPSLYDAYHNIIAVDKNNDKCVYDIVGPICESGDIFAKDRELSCVNKGDFLAIMSAGAYGFSMSSNYNSRCRAAEVLVRDGKANVIRKREAYEDLIRAEL